MPAPRSRRTVDTPLGRYTLTATDEAIVGVWRDGQSHYPDPDRLGDEAPGQHRLLDEAQSQLLAYLQGERDSFDLPVAPTGTPFQLAVWEHLTRIPRGATTTYGEIAAALERPRAAQAVGAAVGANPLSIIVPCHRVIAADGSLTGYAGGIEVKRSLLELEGALPA